MVHSLAMTSLSHGGSLSHEHSPSPDKLTDFIDNISIVSSLIDMKGSLPSNPTCNPVLFAIRYNALNSVEERAPTFKVVVCLMTTPSASCKCSWASDPGAIS